MKDLKEMKHATGDLLVFGSGGTLVLIKRRSEFVTVIHRPVVTFAFHDPKVGTYRRSLQHLNFISVVDGSTLYWCVQSVLHDAMSEDLQFGKTAELELTAVNVNKISATEWLKCKRDT